MRWTSGLDKGIRRNFKNLLKLTHTSIEYNKKPGKLATVKTARDPTVQRDDFYKSGTIHTGPGEPANSRYKETPKTRAELERPPDDDDDDVYIPPPRKTPAQRSTPTPSVAQAARASAVAQSNSFATQANPVAAIPNPRIPQMNGFTQKQETRASIPPPAPPPAPVLPAGPKKDYLKALYDFDGANAGNFKISQGEIFESLKEEQNGRHFPSFNLGLLLSIRRLVSRET